MRLEKCSSKERATGATAFERFPNQGFSESLRFERRSRVCIGRNLIFPPLTVSVAFCFTKVRGAQVLHLKVILSQNEFLEYVFLAIILT